MDARATPQRHVEEAWDAGLDVIDAFFADDHACHDPVMPGLPLGTAGVRVAIDAFLTAMPDGRLTVDDWIDDADSLVARWTWTGTHTGTLMGMAPTGRAATISGMHVFRFREGRIVET